MSILSYVKNMCSWLRLSATTLGAGIIVDYPKPCKKSAILDRAEFKIFTHTKKKFLFLQSPYISCPVCAPD